jgi:HlyD family secretion protein
MRRLRWLRRPSVLAGLLLVGALVAVALWPSAIPVDLAAVERGSMRTTIDEEGETRVRDRFVVSAPVAGQVLRIELEPGDSVKRGETVLATFLPAAPPPLDVRSRAEAQAGVGVADAAIERARAEERRAEAALALAQSELKRHRDLFKEALVSRQVLEAREADARSAEDTRRAAQFATARAEHEREMARARLVTAGSPASAAAVRPLTIRSPIDGVVFKRYRESEAVVPVGEPLIEVGDPRSLEIVTDLLSTDAVKVQPGQRVIIEQWGGAHDLEGRVRLVEPSGFMKISALGVEEQRVNVVIDFKGPAGAPATLGDGYRVEVRVVIWEDEEVLKAPASSLFRRGEQWAVFAIDGDRVRMRDVEVGERNGLEAQILRGLDEGDQVVIHPSDTVTDGARVVPRQS